MLPATPKNWETIEQRGVVETIPENLLREPVDFLFADHFRQRCVCNALEDLICDPENPGRHGRAQEILRYLERELPLHVADEEVDLLPLLTERCVPEDGLAGLTARLAAEHRHDEIHLAAILDGLRQVADGRRLDDGGPFFERVRLFIQAQRDHFAFENAELLPLARRRLTARDKDVLGRRFAERRGVPFPE